MEHNARVRMASAASEGRRARFLLNHIEVLLPFITPQAAAQIRCAAARGRAPVLPAATTACACDVRGGWVVYENSGPAVSLGGLAACLATCRCAGSKQRGVAGIARRRTTRRPTPSTRPWRRSRRACRARCASTRWRACAGWCRAWPTRASTPSWPTRWRAPGPAAPRRRSCMAGRASYATLPTLCRAHGACSGGQAQDLELWSAPCMLPYVLRRACGAAGRAPPGTHAVQVRSMTACELTWRSWARAGPGQDAADDLVPELHADRARRGRALAGGGPAVRAAVLDVRVQALGAQHARRALPLQRRPGAPAPAPRGAPGAGAAGSRARLSLLTARSLRHCARPVLA